MIPMVRTNGVKVFPTPGSEFNDFLFAPVGEETNGMVLTVVSALSRNGVDPWDEAAALSRLSAKAATQSLAAMIGALPHLPMARADPASIAARLVALLPDKSTTGQPQTIYPVATGPTRMPAAFYIVIAILALGAQLLLAGRQPAPPSNEAPAKSAVSAPISSSPQEGK